MKRKSDRLTGEETQVLEPAREAANVYGKSYRQLALGFLILNAMSALLFIGLVDDPVFDDPYNFPDVQRYADEGVSVDTIRQHINPTGPTSFVWMATAVRILGGDGLRDARIAVLVSWLLFGAGILIGARWSSSPQLWYAALLVSLVFPHTVSATGTVLTEGPAILFAILGALAWVESVQSPTVTPGLVAAQIIGGLSMGVAVTCRQYYLALVPAAVGFAMNEWWKRRSEGKLLWGVGVMASLGVAMVPVFLLGLVWNGLSSPNMVSGTSYAIWKSTVGLNMLRPIVAALYTACYLVPLTFPFVLRLGCGQHWRALLVAALCGIVAALSNSFLLQPGPIRSLVQIVGRVPGGEAVFFGLIAGVAVYNALALCDLLRRKRSILVSCPAAAFALLAVVFFIAEQAGIGGNIPFYEKYLLQLAPFLGIVSFALVPRFTWPRLLALTFLSLVSHALLWRHWQGS